MSDTHVWIPTAAVDDAVALIDEYRHTKDLLVRALDRDDPALQVWMQVWGELGELSQAMREVLGEPTRTETRRRVGEGTDPNVRRMRGDRGQR